MLLQQPSGSGCVVDWGGLGGGRGSGGPLLLPCGRAVALRLGGACRNGGAGGRNLALFERDRHRHRWSLIVVGRRVVREARFCGNKDCRARDCLDRRPVSMTTTGVGTHHRHQLDSCSHVDDQTTLVGTVVYQGAERASASEGDREEEAVIVIVGSN